MINLKKIFGFEGKKNRREVIDRRVNHLQAEISDSLAESSPEDFPILKKRGTGRRGKEELLCY
jgi:hypothetical protein